MKILSAEQIRQTDAYTIANEPVSSIDLMERASMVFTSWFCGHLGPSNPVKIFCGTGNNGGDGLATARLLHHRGYDVSVYVVRYSDRTSPDFQRNYKRLLRIGTVPVNDIFDAGDMPQILSGDIIIDAMWGSGLNRPVSGFAVDVFREINQSEAIVVALDIPSGMFADKPSGGPAIEADLTLGFELPKLGFFMPENYRYTGYWEVRSIGLSREFIDRQTTDYHYVDIELARSLLLPSEKFDHKGTYGHTLIAGGSFGKTGAVEMAARACLVAGAGLVTVHIPGCGYGPMQTTVIEAMCSVDRNQTHITAIPCSGNYKVAAIGTGMGLHGETVEAFHKFLKEWDKPLVIDADAINILAEHRDWLNLLPQGTILTPHPGEFRRLAGESKNDFDRLEKLRLLASEYDCYIALKGAHTAIACPDGTVYFNSTGNPGMATAGSGDVLTGIIAGLLSRGYAPEPAAILGVFLHGLAGDMAALSLTEPAVTATTLIDHLPVAWEILYEQ